MSGRGTGGGGLLRLGYSRKGLKKRSARRLVMTLHLYYRGGHSRRENRRDETCRRKKGGVI